MHIPDNYLSPATCGVMFAAATPVLAISLSKTKQQLSKNRELAPMLGICASLSFLVMMFNVPIPGGTTAHAVGATLLAILVGPYAASVAVTVALLLQAFLFGDGGLLALGANIFNMAVVMPFVGYGIYSLLRKHGHEKLGVIFGSYLGINAASLLAGIELGLQPIIAVNASGQPLYNPYPLTISIPAMLFAHLLVAGVVEAFFTYAVYAFVKKVAPAELYTPSRATSKEASKMALGFKYFYYLIGAMVVLSPLGLLASGTAWGEWDPSELLSNMHNEHLGSTLPTGMAHGMNFNALFGDYTVPGTAISLGYILSAITAVLVFLLLGKILMAVGKNNEHAH